jgi:hypothetical protein
MPGLANVRNLEVEALNALGQLRLLIRSGTDRERLEGALDRFVWDLNLLQGKGRQTPPAAEAGDMPAPDGDQGSQFAPEDECGFCHCRELRPANGEGTVLECAVCGTVHDLI